VSKYRNSLPQLSGGNFLSDSGLETTLIFHEGMDLPLFASFDVLRTTEGRAAIERYFRRHARIARHHGTGFILESATWRASPEWGAKLGYSEKALETVNREALEMLLPLREEFEREGGQPVIVSGNIGPRGDGYNPSKLMSAEEAERYHAFQVGIFADAGADMICAMTMNYVEEAIGIVNAARAAGIPVAIAFTVETDGRLPTGQSLADAIRQTDAATGAHAAYYMINCAHPDHFAGVLVGDDWTRRIMGVRANASRLSHKQLDEATELDPGDPLELGGDYRRLRDHLPNLSVYGGCCGTDHRHIESIAFHCVAADAPWRA